MSSDSVDAAIHIIKDVFFQGFVPTIALCVMIFYLLWNTDKNSSESNPSAIEELVLDGKKNLLDFIQTKKISLLIIHGSTNPQSSRFAEIICDEAEKKNVNPLMVEADEVDFDVLLKLREIQDFALIICTENLDDCTPPEKCIDMFTWVEEAKENALAGMNFAVFGFDSNLEGKDSNAVAKAINVNLKRLGGKQMLEVGHTTCQDADLDTSFEDKEFLRWTEDFITSFGKSTEPKDFEKISQVETLASCASRSVPDVANVNLSDGNQPSKVILIADDKVASYQIQEELTKTCKNLTVLNNEDINMEDSEFTDNLKKSTVIYCTYSSKEESTTEKKAQLLVAFLKEDTIRHIILGMKQDTNESDELEQRVAWVVGNMWDEIKENNQESKAPEDWMKKLVALI